MSAEDLSYVPRVISHPDPSRPNDLIKIDPYLFQGMVLPATMRSARMRESYRMGGIVEAFLVMLWVYIRTRAALALDSRFRVVILRRRTSSPLWKTVHVEFLPDELSADARLVEVLSEWDSFEFTQAEAIPWTAEKKLRRSA